MISEEQLKAASTDEDFVALGFSFVGKLCEEPGYEDEYERLWLLENSEGERIVVCDYGNCYSGFDRVL